VFLCHEPNIHIRFPLTTLFRAARVASTRRDNHVQTKIRRPVQAEVRGPAD
jgi:hypothetical protein